MKFSYYQSKEHSILLQPFSHKYFNDYFRDYVNTGIVKAKKPEVTELLHNHISY